MGWQSILHLWQSHLLPWRRLYVSLRWCCRLDSQLRWAQIFLVCPRDFLGSSVPLIRDGLLFHTFTCSRKVALMPRSKLIDRGAGAAKYVPAATLNSTDVGGSITILLTRLVVLTLSIVAVEPFVICLLRHWRGQGLEFWPFLPSMSWMLLADNLDWLTHRCRSCLPSSCAWVWAGESPAWPTASLCWSLKTPTTNWLGRPDFLFGARLCFHGGELS